MTKELSFIKLLEWARAILEGKHTYKTFFKNTSFENDLPVWMAEFAARALEEQAQEPEMVTVEWRKVSDIVYTATKVYKEQVEILQKALEEEKHSHVRTRDDWQTTKRQLQHLQLTGYQSPETPVAPLPPAEPA